MAYDEAKQQAINMGALEPHGLKERMAAGLMANEGRWFSQTPLAQSRLEAWTQAILNGQDPRSLG